MFGEFSMKKSTVSFSSFAFLSCRIICFVVFLIFTNPFYSWAEEQPTLDPVREESGISTIEAHEMTFLDKKIAAEKHLLRNRFAIVPHKPNYILPVTYNPTPNNESFSDLKGDVNHVEMKFQLSFKIALMRGIFRDIGYLFFGYSQQSYWQAYNSLLSSPFRETNYEPELFLRFYTDQDVLGLQNKMISFGFVHQSNGRGEPLSRSWNRVYADFVFDRGNFYLSVKPWYRIPEDAEDDDNPDIDEYVGYGEVYAMYAMENSSLGVLLRNNLRSHNRWGVQLDWTFPLGETLKGYLQFYSGYGENLIDYNHKNSRIGLGILLTDWL